MVSTRSKKRASIGPSATDSGSWTRVLVTGANAGLGLDTCKRIIHEFLTHRPETQSLHLIITTRSSAKSSATITNLWQYATTSIPSFRSSSSGPDDEDSRLRITSAELDLTHLPSVIHAARSLRDELPSLHAVVFNAGIAGWTGLNWFRAIYEVTVDPVYGTTWPSVYLKNALGLRTKPQLSSGSGISEPALNEVFCANVFGHYLLAHELGPLLAAAAPQHPGRVIWVSSIEAVGSDFNVHDLQALDQGRAYNSSKRLTDILALTSTAASTQPYVRALFSDPESLFQDAGPVSPLPRQYVCHPGVVSTEIMPLHPVVAWAKRMSFYMARLLGSPWHTITGHKAATAAAWLVLSAQTTLDTLEEREGPGKWGSATDWWGNERVKRTEVDGWGFGGRVEPSAPVGEHRRGRNKYARDLTEEEREGFEELGVQCWETLEDMRTQWMELLQKTQAI